MTRDELLSQIAKAIRDAFALIVADASNNVILGELDKAIAAGDYEKVWLLIGMNQAMFRPLMQAIDQAFERGADFVVSEWPKYLHMDNGKGVFRFDTADPAAREWVRNKSSELITRITNETRNAVRVTMEEGVIVGKNPRAVALNIVGRIGEDGKRVGGVIGLTTEQQAWVSRARRELQDLDARYFTRELRDRRFDGIVRRAIEAGKPLTVNDIERLLVRYSDRILKYRGEMIARTEAMSAMSASAYEATRQVVATGAAREKDVKRTWRTAKDKDVRHSHEAMEGVSVSLNEPFVLPSGDRMMYPRDRSLGARAKEIIACRCNEEVEIDWIGAALDD